MSQRQKKQVCAVGQYVVELAAMNVTKTELRQYNLAIITTVETICSSVLRSII